MTNKKEVNVRKERRFPSRETLVDLQKIPVTTSFTSLPDTIAGIIQRSEKIPLNVLFPVGASTAEITRIDEAKRQGGKINIYEGKDAKQLQKKETVIMRKIVKEFLKNSNAMELFEEYLSILIENHPDLIRAEFTKFTLPRWQYNIENFHYFNNLGNKVKSKDPKNEDSLYRKKILLLLEGILNKAGGAIKSRLSAILEETASGKNSGQESLAITLGFLSNFLRGGIFYGLRENGDISYEPRLIAKRVIEGSYYFGPENFHYGQPAYFVTTAEGETSQHEVKVPIIIIGFDKRSGKYFAKRDESQSATSGYIYVDRDEIE